MGRGARSVTRPISNWLTVCNFAICLRLVWTFRASYNTCQPRSPRLSETLTRDYKSAMANRSKCRLACRADFVETQTRICETPCGRLQPLPAEIEKKKRRCNRFSFTPLSPRRYRLLHLVEFVMYYEFRARHFDVVSPRNIVTPTRLHPVNFASVLSNGRVTVYPRL